MPEKILRASPLRQPPIGFAVWRETPAIMKGPHVHGDVEINLLTHGSCRYSWSGGHATLFAGDIGVFWGGIPHQTVHRSDDAAGIWATLPLDWILRWPGTSGMAAVLLKGTFVRTKSLPRDREIFSQWAGDLAENPAGSAAIVALEIEAWLSRLALRGLGRPHSDNSWNAAHAGKIARIADFLAARYTDPIRVEDVAAAAGLHPKYLLTVFRRQCGLTLWEYVLRLRLAHAQRLLLTTDRKVIDAALESGFGSVSAFYLAFRKFHPGVTPKQFRGGDFGSANVN